MIYEQQYADNGKWSLVRAIDPLKWGNWCDRRMQSKGTATKMI